MEYKYPSLRTTLPVAGYYARLDAGAAATDQFTVDGANDGTLTGTTRAGSPLAYSFDGNDYIRVAAGFPSWKAVGFWVKTTRTSQITFVESYVNATSGILVYMNSAGKVLCDGRSAGTYRSSGASAASINDGNWHHIVGQYESGKFQIWIDGTKRSESAGVAAPTSAAHINIGGVQASTAGGAPNSEYMVGDLDDFVFYAAGQDATNIGYLASERGAIYAEIAISQRRRTAQASIRSTF